MSRLVNHNELRVIGMSRSGNHALINWITEQLPGRYCFLNCCQGKSNPYETALPLDTGERVLSNIAGFDLARERAGDFSDKDWLLFSHEDTFLGMACSHLFERRHDEWVGSSHRRIDLLLLRDPFNLFASRLALGGAWINWRTAARIWKQHARQFVEGPRALRHDPVLVRYDLWVTSRQYRQELAGQLGFAFTDSGIDAVPACGGGSSFDGDAYDGAAGRMDVFGRWRRWIDEPMYRDLFDDELIAMSHDLFGDLPAAAALSRRTG